MKKVIAHFIEQCITFQRVKEEHQRPFGLLRPLLLQEWKWGYIVMDLVVEFPRTQKCYNSIWVIIDRITKFANFLHVKRTYTSYKYA